MSALRSALARVVGSVREAWAGAPRRRGVGDQTFWLSELMRAATLGSNGLPVGSPYAYHTWVHTAVAVRARALASIPFGIFTGTPGDAKPVLDGPWVELFRRPAPGMRGRELWIAPETYLCLPGGECFWVLEGRGEDLAEGEIPVLIKVLPGGRYARPQRDPRTGEILGWEFRPKGSRQPLLIPNHRCIQFRKFNPEDPERGLSDLEAAMLGVESDSLAARWNRAFFLNDATPRGIVSTPAGYVLTPEQVEQNRKEWDDTVKGPDRAHRVKMLQGGTTFTSISETHNEMGFLEQRKWSRDEIAAVFQVPQFFMGLTADLKYATAREAKRVLYESTIVPEGDELADVLEATLFRRQVDGKVRAAAALKGQRAVFGAFDTSTVEALKDAYSEKLLHQEKLLVAGYAPDEVNDHLELGLPPMPNGSGKVGLVSFGLAPREEVAKGTPAVPPADPQGDPNANPPSKGDPPPPERQRADRMDAGKRRRMRTWLELVTHVYTPGERDFTAAVRKHFRRIRDDVSGFLGGSRDAKTRMSKAELDTFLASKRQEWHEALKKLVKPVYGATSEKALKHLEAQLGGFDVVKTGDPAILDFLSGKVLNIVGIDETQIANIRSTLVEGMGEAEPVSALALRLDRETAVGETRAKAIARTEVASAANGSRFLAMKEEGVTGQEWVTAGDDNVRESHVALDGEVVPLGAPFQAAGGPLRFPGDPEGPPEEIVNCRCATGPVE